MDRFRGFQAAESNARQKGKALMDPLSLPPLMSVFVGVAIAVWAAGSIKLSDATDVLSELFGLGEALGD